MIVINKGKIAEKGTHDELLQKGGAYKRLVLRQLSASGGGVPGAVGENENGAINVKLDDVDELDYDEDEK